MEERKKYCLFIHNGPVEWDMSRVSFALYPSCANSKLEALLKQYNRLYEPTRRSYKVLRYYFEVIN